jgi:hypothetical protein
VIERYGGLNDYPPFRLLGRATLSDLKAITQIASQLNSLPAYPCEPIFCPSDDGSHFDIVFDYEDGVSTAVKVGAQGCQAVYVGGSPDPVAWAIGSPSLLETINRLIRSP